MHSDGIRWGWTVSQYLINWTLKIYQPAEILQSSLEVLKRINDPLPPLSLIRDPQGLQHDIGMHIGCLLCVASLHGKALCGTAVWLMRDVGDPQWCSSVDSCGLVGAHAVRCGGVVRWGPSSAAVVQYVGWEYVAGGPSAPSRSKVGQTYSGFCISSPCLLVIPLQVDRDILSQF